MARQKQIKPLQRATSSEIMQRDTPKSGESAKEADTPGLMQLAVCVSGIYASFLSWGVLQEAITTTSYPVRAPTAADPKPPTERFTYSIVLNSIQSSFAAITGFIYLYFSTSRGRGQKVPPVFPNKQILVPLLLVSICSSLASPFGYASLAHIDYLTFILAKSCKLLPVMFLHLTIFRKRYPLYKYGVVLLVTLGVATFTLHHPGTSKKLAAKSSSSSSSTQSGSGSGSSLYGISLLSINLLLDGLTNTVQDHVFGSPHRYTSYSGPQMMVAQNVLSTALSAVYLSLAPFVAANGYLSSSLPLPLPISPSSGSGSGSGSELQSAISFMSRHPEALKHVLGFAACGAVGQVFIFYTLSKFSSLLLVTVTVTRKMLTMLLSVFWFGHALHPKQWVGVVLVFGGVGAEGAVQKREKERKIRARAGPAGVGVGGDGNGNGKKGV